MIEHARGSRFRPAESRAEVARRQCKTEFEPRIACGGEQVQGPDADGNGLIFTVGAYRERRDSTNEALITASLKPLCAAST